MRGTYFQENHLLTAAEAATDWDSLSASNSRRADPSLESRRDAHLSGRHGLRAGLAGSLNGYHVCSGNLTYSENL